MKVGDLISCRHGIGVVIKTRPETDFLHGRATVVCVGRPTVLYVGWGETRVISESTNGNKEKETKSG